MIEISKALALIDGCKISLKKETISLLDAGGRILADDVIAPVAMPTFSNSAMDGFAVCWDSLDPDAQPIAELKISGESQAGLPFEGDFDGSIAVRISTGAKLPDNYDTIIPVEDCIENEGLIRVTQVRSKGQHVRMAGEEFMEGESLLYAGQQIGSSQIGLLASVGIKDVQIYAVPKVSLLVTGDELRNQEVDASQGLIFDSNTPMLTNAIKSAGAELIRTIHVSDDLDATCEAIGQASRDSDLIICTGGVSVGPHDHIKNASARVGFAEVFWKIRQKPGKPLFMAHSESCILLGLPGNPVSAQVCFHYYGIRLIHNLSGRNRVPNSRFGQFEKDVANPSDRAQFLRVVIVDKATSPITLAVLERQGSHMLSSIGQASGYVLFEGQTSIRRGDIVQFHSFEEV